MRKTILTTVLMVLCGFVLLLPLIPGFTTTAWDQGQQCINLSLSPGIAQNLSITINTSNIAFQEANISITGYNYTTPGIIISRDWDTGNITGWENTTTSGNVSLGKCSEINGGCVDNDTNTYAMRDFSLSSHYSTFNFSSNYTEGVNVSFTIRGHQGAGTVDVTDTVNNLYDVTRITFDYAGGQDWYAYPGPVKIADNRYLKWMNVTFIIHIWNQTYEIWVDDIYNLTLPLIDTVTHVNKLRMSAQQTGFPIFLDNLEVNPLTPYPENITLYLNHTHEEYNNVSTFNGLDNISLNLTYLNEFYGIENNLTYGFISTDYGIVEACLIHYNYSFESNATLYDEITKAVIDDDTCHFAIVSKDNESVNHYNQTATNGRFNFSGLEPDVYQFLFNCDNYGQYNQRVWWANLPFNEVAFDLKFYLLNQSSNNATPILVSVVDEALRPVSGYYVSIYKFIPENGTSIPLETQRTNFNGEVLFRLIPLEPFYYFYVYDENFNRVFDSERTRILTDTLNIQIINEDDYVGSIKDVLGLDYNVNVNNVTRMFSFTWTDTNQILNYVRLDVDHVGSFGTTNICDNVSFSSSGVLYCYLRNVSGRGSYLYSVVADTKSNFSEGPLAGGEIILNPDPGTLGNVGVLLALILIGLFMFAGVGTSLGKGNPAFIILFGLVGLGVSSLLLLINISLAIFVGLAIGGGLVIYGLRT